MDVDWLFDTNNTHGNGINTTVTEKEPLKDNKINEKEKGYLLFSDNESYYERRIVYFIPHLFSPISTRQVFHHATCQQHLRLPIFVSIGESPTTILAAALGETPTGYEGGTSCW